MEFFSETGLWSYLQFIGFSRILLQVIVFILCFTGKEDVIMDQGQNTPQRPQAIIVKSTKNVGLAAGLALFFGPLFDTQGCACHVPCQCRRRFFDARDGLLAHAADLCDLGVHGGKEVQRGTVRRTRLMHVSLNYGGIML